MKIPFNDRRENLNRRWTDIRKINRLRFDELCESIENCRDLGRDEFLQLKALADRKLVDFNVPHTTGRS